MAKLSRLEVEYHTEARQSGDRGKPCALFSSWVGQWLTFHCTSDLEVAGHGMYSRKCIMHFSWKLIVK